MERKIVNVDMTAVKKTLLHTLELAVVFGAAFLVLNSLGLGSPSTQYALTLALGALAKYARASDTVPVDDYVNKVL